MSIRHAIGFLFVSTAVMAQGAPQKSIIVADMNRNVAACDDFYEYANGGWRAANPIPASMPRWSRRWEAGESTKDKLRAILEETAAMTNPPKGSVEQLTGDFYSTCMDESQANRLGAQPIKTMLDEIAAVKTGADLQQAIAKLQAIGIAAPFGLYGSSDAHTPTDVIGYVTAAGLGMPDRDYYVKTEARFQDAREKYRAHVARFFALAGWPVTESAAAADTVFRVEKQLADASLDNVALRDPAATDHKMPFADLQKLTPAFDWSVFARRVGLPAAPINVDQPKFRTEVNRQLTETPLADWKTYLSWNVISAAAPTLSDAFVQEDFDFNGAYLAGAKEMKPRWKRCVESTDGWLGEALGKKYVEKYFPPEAKARMQELVKNLRLAMGETIQGLDWMSAPTKAKALEKLSTFNPKVGYPDKWKDYSRVEIARRSGWANQLATRAFAVQDSLSIIGKPLDRGRWLMTPPTSDAYYNPLLNEIVFPAGILQPPAFSVAASDAVNYGAIGVVIGHEISHGFDDQGAQFDAQGRLNNWWTPEDLKKFQEKTQCVVNQFDSYFVEPGLHHNGKLVLGESIGDLAGAKIAYRAFQIAQRGKPPLPAVDGFTPDQPFFIAWGQFRGDAVRPEFARTMVQGDPHPIGKFRVIGPLSNLPAFAEAFSCKPGTPMTRAKRCEVW
jgi:endothelin-converting enzyme/putative endopeptidase